MVAGERDLRPPPITAPLMAATTGFLLCAAQALPHVSSTSAALLRVWIIEMSAPAMKSELAADEHGPWMAGRRRRSNTTLKPREMYSSVFAFAGVDGNGSDVVDDLGGGFGGAVHSR